MKLASLVVRAAAVPLAPILASSAAQSAEPRCAKHASIVEQLATRYGETRQGMGLDQSNLVEMFASAETGTWTILVTTPEGTTCLVAAGEHWEAAAPLAGAAGEDA